MHRRNVFPARFDICLRAFCPSHEVASPCARKNSSPSGLPRQAGVGARSRRAFRSVMLPPISVLKGGLARGALHEVFRPVPVMKRQQRVLRPGLLARVAARRRLLWIRQDFFRARIRRAFGHRAFLNLELIQRACCCCAWPMRRMLFARQMMRSPVRPWGLSSSKFRAGQKFST